MSIYRSCVLQRIFTHKSDARQVQILRFKPPSLFLDGSTGHGDINVAVVLKWSIEQCKLRVVISDVELLKMH